MADQAYINALAEKERLLKELEKVNHFLKLYQRFTPKDAQKVPDGAPDVPLPSFKPAAKGKTSVPDKFAPIILRTLLLAGRPLSRSELLKTLEKDGTPVPGENAGKNLGTIMWRLKDQFVNLAPFGYWVAGVHLPHIGYRPEGGKTLHLARQEVESTY